ncbi:MAG: sigma-70 family RNA polymerase sigma factor [Limisphaerales bacterium]
MNEVSKTPLAVEGDIPTRQSLLSRLRSWDDNVSWQVFFDTYWRLIYRCAKRAGLNDAEAEDVVQETVLAVAKSIPTFEYDPNKGSFKSWLFGVTRNRILLHFRRVAKEHRLIDLRPLRSDSHAKTSTIDRVADPQGMEIERIWDHEWETNLKQAAMERVKRHVNLKHFQVFDLCLCGHNPADIARTLRVRQAHVYLIRHRLMKLLRREIEHLLQSPLQ